MDQLTAMGFSEDDARGAIIAENGDVALAVARLVGSQAPRQVGAQSVTQNATGGGAGGGAAAAARLLFGGRASSPPRGAGGGCGDGGGGGGGGGGTASRGAHSPDPASLGPALGRAAAAAAVFFMLAAMAIPEIGAGITLIVVGCSPCPLVLAPFPHFVEHAHTRPYTHAHFPCA